MSGSAPPKPPPSGAMSLYANLLDPKAAVAGEMAAPNTRAPEKNGDDAGVDRKPLDPAMLRFQPIRRPQPGQKSKPKGSFLKIGAVTTLATTTRATTASASPAASPAASADHSAPPPPSQQPPRSKLADWAATEEDEFTYGLGKRNRGGRKAKKKNNRDGRDRQTDWDELYDPARPTNVEEYLRSDERIAEIMEWKAVLYAHRRRREQNRTRSRSRSSRRSSDSSEAARAPKTNQFAPPPLYSFAPPQPSPPRVSEEPAVPTLMDDATGDDAHAHRLTLGKGLEGDAAPPLPDPIPAATISRAPVRYEPTLLPNEEGEGDDMEIDGHVDERPGIGLSNNDDPDAPRSNRPGQTGFAARMMEKMGWEKGKGLGAEESGITSGLSVKVERRRKRPDAEIGGLASLGSMARVVGGSRAAQDVGRFGSMSEVVALFGMLDGMEDVAGEVAEGLAQEIGEECGEKYGRVERLHIDVNTRQVFIKFTDQVSALRAVNALNGRIFNGNEISPKFFSLEKFEQGFYQ